MIGFYEICLKNYFCFGYLWIRQKSQRTQSSTSNLNKNTFQYNLLLRELTTNLFFQNRLCGVSWRCWDVKTKSYFESNLTIQTKSYFGSNLTIQTKSYFGSNLTIRCLRTEDRARGCRWTTVLRICPETWRPARPGTCSTSSWLENLFEPLHLCTG